MEKEKLLYKILHFERLVKECNQLLMDYFNLSICPLLAKRNGLIPSKGIIKNNNEIIHYTFHGMGCRFENNYIIDFDYSFGDFIYKGFEVDKLFEFVISDNDLYDNLKTKELFLDALSKLESEHLIVKNESNIDTYEYSLVTE